MNSPSNIDKSNRNRIAKGRNYITGWATDDELAVSVKLEYYEQINHVTSTAKYISHCKGGEKKWKACTCKLSVTKRVSLPPAIWRAGQQTSGEQRVNVYSLWSALVSSAPVSHSVHRLAVKRQWLIIQVLINISIKPAALSLTINNFAERTNYHQLMLMFTFM